MFLPAFQVPVGFLPGYSGCCRSLFIEATLSAKPVFSRQRSGAFRTKLLMLRPGLIRLICGCCSGYFSFKTLLVKSAFVAKACARFKTGSALRAVFHGVAV
jgi:hypothetical protein